MTQIKKLLTGTVFLSILTLTAAAQSPAQLKAEAIKVSYILALGKAASQGELNYWMGQNIAGPDMVKTLVESHRTYLQQNPEVKRDMINRSFKSAYGRAPQGNEVSTNMGQNYIYSDWITNHTAWLRKTPGDYENVIRYAYQNVMGRQPQAGEMAYWKQKPAMAYYLLASCVENCRNSKGNGTCTVNTMGGTSSFATVENVSAQTASQAAGVVASGGGNVVAAGGGNVVAAGGGNLVASGGGNLVASGGGN